MIILTAAGGETLEAAIRDVFEKSDYLLVYDTEQDLFDGLRLNPVARGPGEAQQQAARLVVEQDAQALLTRGVGAESARILAAAAVQVFQVEREMPAREALEAFSRGALPLAEAPDEGLFHDVPGKPATDAITPARPGEGVGRGQQRWDASESRKADMVCPFCGHAGTLEPGQDPVAQDCPECGKPMTRQPVEENREGWKKGFLSEEAPRDANDYPTR